MLAALMMSLPAGWTFAQPAPVFDGEPAITRAGDGCEISFKITTPTDVTVRVVDEKGNVVRHLAAGMVGLEKAASPFAPKSLAQKIAWDGKDDAGRPAPPGCKVSIAAGMQVKFDKFILWEPNAFVPDAQGELIVAGPNNEYYICQNRGTYCRSTVRVLNGEGKFVRGFWPYHLNQPAAKDFLLKPNPVQCERDERGFQFEGIDDWGGNRVPFSVCHDLTFFFHTNYSAAVVTTDGCMVAVPAYAGRIRSSLWRLSPEGFPGAKNWMVPWHPTSYPEAKDVAPRQKALWQSGRAGGWKLAAGLDGDFYLADGIHNIVAHFKAKDFSPVNFTWSGTKKLDAPRNWIGELNTQGDDGDHFNFKFEEKQPFGIVVDGKGNLLVLDGDVVKAYDKDGKFMEVKPRAQSDFDKTFVPVRDGGLGWNDIRKTGGASGVPAALITAGQNPRALCFPGFLRVDSAGRLYLSEERAERTVSDVEGKTLTRQALGGAGTAFGYGYMAVDSVDNLYVAVQKGYNGYGRVLKFSPDGKPMTFGGKEAIDTNGLDANVQIRGVHVARNGDIYMALKVGGEASTQPAFINVYSPDGALKKEALAKGACVNDVAIDREGNIYFLEGVKTFKGIPAHMEWPPPYLSPDEARLIPGPSTGGGNVIAPMGDDGKVRDDQIIKRCSLLGRLVKLAPEGGELDRKGMIWSRAGASGLSPVEGKPERETAAQICLDPDERIWVPDPLMYCVTAVDRAGNLIARVGTYGSEDCKGGGKDRKLEGTNIVIDPEIPLARPSGMAVYKDYLLISDMYAHRVMRCKIEYREKRDLAAN
jgi:hypothetical protein